MNRTTPTAGGPTRAVRLPIRLAVLAAAAALVSTVPLVLPAVTTTPVASAQDLALPAGVDPRNFQRTQWGTVLGHPVTVYVPRVVEQGQPVRLVVSGFTNLAGTDGALFGVKFDGGAIARTVLLDPAATGQATAAQRATLWAAVRADATGHAAVDVEFPTAATATNTDKVGFGPGTVHTFTINSGSMSGTGPDGKNLDPGGSAESAPFTVIDPGTLDAALSEWAYTPVGQPDALAALATVVDLAGASAVDRDTTSMTLTAPGVAPGTWLHVTPAAGGQTSTATALSGQWVQVGAGGTATFRTSGLPSGSYRAIVHSSVEAGSFPVVGAVGWTHTGEATGTARVTTSVITPTGPSFFGSPLTPWWTTARPSSAARPATITSTRPAAAPAGGGGNTGAGAVPAPVAAAAASPAGAAAALPTTVPIARAAGSAGTASAVVAPAALAAGADPADAGVRTDSASLLAADARDPGGVDANLVLMAVAAALLLMVGSCASTLVVVGRVVRRAPLMSDSHAHLPEDR